MAEAVISDMMTEKTGLFFLVLFVKSRVPNNIQIIGQSRIKEGSRIAIGNTITVKIRGSQMPAKIIEISESCDYLYNNFDELKFTYLKSAHEKAQHDAREIEKINLAIEELTLTKAECVDKLEIMNQQLATLSLQPNHEVSSNNIQRDFDEAIEEINRTQADCLDKLEVMNQQLTNLTIKPKVEKSPQKKHKNGEHSLQKQNGDEERIRFGPNGTSIAVNIYNSIVWSNLKTAVSTLLCGLFDPKTLATHRMKGGGCRRCQKDSRPKLNNNKIKDIIDLVSTKCNVTPSVVKKYIIGKCARESLYYMIRTNSKREYHSYFRDGTGPSCNNPNN